MARIKPQALLQQSKKKKGPSRISVTTIILYVSITVVMMFFLYSTYRHWSRRSQFQVEERLSAVENGSSFGDIKKSDIPRYAIREFFKSKLARIFKQDHLFGTEILSTVKGSITVELYREGSPQVVDEFVKLCQEGRFKDMPFHHVIKNFVIQGSNFDRPGAMEDWTLRGKHNSQLGTSLKHEAFMLGTSKVKQNKEEFDLFITTAPIPDLNDKLIVFGRVVKGEDVVQEIEEVDTDEHYRPKSPIGTTDITLKQKA